MTNLALQCWGVPCRVPAGDAHNMSLYTGSERRNDIAKEDEIQVSCYRNASGLRTLQLQRLKTTKGKGSE